MQTAPHSTPTRPVQKARRRAHLVGQYIWKNRKPRKVASFWIFDVLAEVEVETTASADATDAEIVTLKAKWVRGTQAAGEVELQFGEWFLPDVREERDEGKFTIRFKKEAKLAGGKVVIKPHLELSTDVVKIEVVIRPLKLPLKDVGKKLIDEIFDFFGKQLVGGMIKRVAAALLGGTLTRILLGGKPNVSVTPDPNNVQGQRTALTLSGGASTSLKLLQEWATTQDWQVWANTKKALETISPDLPVDDFVRRFRWHEVALMFAVAAYILRKITKDEIKDIAGVCSAQASYAGIAAAVQYAEARIRDDTYEFDVAEFADDPLTSPVAEPTSPTQRGRPRAAVAMCSARALLVSTRRGADHALPHDMFCSGVIGPRRAPSAERSLCDKPFRR